MTKTNDKTDYVIDGYQTFHGTGGQSLKSGCGFFVKEGLKYKRRTDLEMSFKDKNNEFQSCWIEIINNPTPNIIIGCYYRHPKKPSNGIFIKKLNDTLRKLRKANNKHVLICGDINYNLLNYKHNEYIRNFLNTMNSNLLQPCIIEPTRIFDKQKSTLIDNIFVNLFNKELKSGNLVEKISDHLPNFIIIKNINKKISIQNIKVRELNSFDKDKYLEDLEEPEDLHLQKYNNVNQMFNAYHDKLLLIINKHALYKTLSKKETKLKFKPRITKIVLKFIKKTCVLIENL